MVQFVCHRCAFLLKFLLPSLHCVRPVHKSGEYYGFYRASICEGGLGSRNFVCPFVCLSVTRMVCDKTKWRTADIFIPHERAITLLLLYQEWLVGDAPFPLKSASKWPTPFEKRRLRPISAHNVSTVGDSEKKSNYDEYKVDRGLFNEP